MLGTDSGRRIVFGDGVAATETSRLKKILKRRLEALHSRSKGPRIPKSRRMCSYHSTHHQAGTSEWFFHLTISSSFISTCNRSRSGTHLTRGYVIFHPDNDSRPRARSLFCSTTPPGLTSVKRGTTSSIRPAKSRKCAEKRDTMLEKVFDVFTRKFVLRPFLIPPGKLLNGQVLRPREEKRVRSWPYTVLSWNFQAGGAEAILQPAALRQNRLPPSQAEDVCVQYDLLEQYPHIIVSMVLTTCGKRSNLVCVTQPQIP